MIIQPSQFKYHDSYSTIIICGDNAFLIDHILEQLHPYIGFMKKYNYIYSNEDRFDMNSVVRNDNRWSLIRKLNYIYIPCYGWNIAETKNILHDIQNEILIQIAHNSCKKLFNLISSLKDNEIEMLYEKHFTRTEYSVKSDIISLLEPS